MKDQKTKFGLAPIADANAHILILGSLPGERSLADQRYYAHPQNQFWRLIGFTIGADLTALDYTDRIDILQAKGIALWDMVAVGKRPGSLDQDLKVEKLHDVAALVATLPQLRLVAFNGTKAAVLGRKIRDINQVQRITLPSSSPANTASFDQKLLQWQYLQNYICVRRVQG
ncbi:MAG: DNA-deoxyinosine glycosylase [Sphingorhabdus sp.]